MADFRSRSINTRFSGLATSVIIFGVIGGVALFGFETLRQMRRTPKTYVPPFWSRDPKRRTGGAGGVYGQAAKDDASHVDANNAIGVREKLTCEDWEMGHLYTARCFHATSPSPPMSRWPLGWALQALKLDDWWYATHTGMDTVVYVRFLKALFYWMLLQTLTTAPILLAVHLHFAETSDGGSHDLTDMSQASLSYLVTKTLCPCNATSPRGVNCVDGTFVANSSYSADNCRHIPNEQGRKFLWIHLCLLWFITFTWFFALVWIAKGSLRTRREWIGEVRRRRQAGQMKAKDDSTIANGEPAANGNGTHTRELVAGTATTSANNSSTQSEIMAKAHSIEESEGWRQRTMLVTNLPPNMRDEASIRRYFEEFLRPDDATFKSSQQEQTSNDSSYNREDAHLEPLTGSSRARAAADEAMGPEPDTHPERHLRSPVQTVVLVRKMNELSAMLTRRQDVLAQLEAAHIKLAQTVLVKVRKHARKARGEATPPEEKEMEDELEGTSTQRLMRRLKNLSGSSDEDTTALAANSEKSKMSQLMAHLGPFVSPDRFHETAKHGLHGKNPPQTVWEALHEIPRELLDPYQPVTRLSSLFRGQKVPTIDYLLTKLNLLTALVTEMRARPPTSYEATSTAFVTFRDPRQARMVWRELKSQIVVKVRPAPEVKDLDWERLMRTSFTGDIVRGFGVSSFFWFFTIIWVVPVNLLATSLFSVQSLEKPFPAVANFFESHQQLESFISVTLPTLIVSVLTMCVPELIFQISKRAQGFVTFSALYDQCLCRYWKFVICNVVIFFCVGSTTVKSVIFQLGTTDDSLLSGIAYAFPTAAPFYVSYLILGMALHTGFELVGFMVPLIQHLGARKAKTPRIRAIKTLPRNFNRYYWLPFHVLILSIVFLFALLNPLVIPFALVYIFVAMTVFKKNLAYQYYRRFNEKEGVFYYIRILRFSLDGLMVAQVVLLVFFSVTRQESAYIGLTAVLLPITTAFKLLATRLWKSQCRAIEDDEANALCGIADFAESVGTISRLHDPEDGKSALHVGQPADARATGRYPTIVAPPPSSSRLVNAWNRIHNSFNANGHDSPSYFAEASARGSNVNAFTVTQAVASAPMSKVKHKAGRGFKYAKAGVDVNRAAPAGAYNARESLALSSFPHKDEQQQNTEAPNDRLDGATARDLKEFLDGAEEKHFGAKRKEYSTIRLVRKHRTSGRGSDAPFLSGFESLTSHAPIIEHEDADTLHSLDDGEYEELLSLSRREEAEERRRRASRRRGASEGIPSSSSQYIETQSSQVPGEVTNEKSKIVRNDSETSTDSKISDDDADMPLVRPHASISWDDTPNNSARYNNPFYSIELDPFLWFPRDPLVRIDLCDSIEWYGPAFVSSQGGSGMVGEWEEDEEDEEVEVASHSQAGNTDTVVHGGEASIFSHSESFRGDERIMFTGALAQRMQTAENLDENKDPAASLTRNEMADYKRALEEEDNEVIEEEDEEAGELTHVSNIHHLRIPRRNDSIRSRGSSFLGRSGSRRRMSASSSGRLESGFMGGAGSIRLSPKVEKSQQDAQLTSSDGSGHLQATQRPSLHNRRMPSFVSHRSGQSVTSEHRQKGVPAPSITMRKALRAEVLQEESIRFMKEHAKRRREHATDGTLNTKERREPSSAAGQDSSQILRRISPSHTRFFSHGEPATASVTSPKSTASKRFSSMARAAVAQKRAEDASRDSALQKGAPSDGIPLQDVASATHRAEHDDVNALGEPTVSGAPASQDVKGKAPAQE